MDLPNDPNFEEFSKVFAHFQITAEETEVLSNPVRCCLVIIVNILHTILYILHLQTYQILVEPKEEEKVETPAALIEAKVSDSEDESTIDSDSDRGEKVSKKKLRKLNRLSVAQLKQLVKRPEVVEVGNTMRLRPDNLIKRMLMPSFRLYSG